VQVRATDPKTVGGALIEAVNLGAKPPDRGQRRTEELCS
jgi:hypothetical protein